jgi:hypothetical protein
MDSSVRWNDEQIEGSRPYVGFVCLPHDERGVSRLGGIVHAR